MAVNLKVTLFVIELREIDFSPVLMQVYFVDWSSPV